MSYFGEADWLHDNGFPQSILEPLQDEFRSVFEAADHAYQEDRERVESVDGVGPAAADRLAELSPLNAPGVWDSEKTGDGGYRFTAGDATVWMEPDGDRWVCDGEWPDGSMLGVWRFNIYDTGRVPAWWSVKSVVEANPDGPDSDVPRNVEAGEAWFRYRNFDDVAVWEHEKSTAEVMISGKGEAWTLSVSWEQRGETRRRDCVELVRGDRNQAFDVVGGVLDVAPWIVACERDEYDPIDPEPTTTEQAGLSGWS